MVSDPLDAVLAEVRRRLQAGREGNFVAELGGPDQGFALYWGQLNATTPPGSPSDERYLLDEVRPKDVGSNGGIEWELVPGGRRNEVAWNVAEAIERTHTLPVGLVVLVREELDRSSPSEFRSIFFCSVGGGGRESRMCRIESFNGQSGTYTVRPVTWDGSEWVDDGSAVSQVHNVGEVQAGEGGYLSGPAGKDIYVRLYDENNEPFLVVHPPRMP
jgi:hypothetical protein